MTTPEHIIKEWERKQSEGCYASYKESMADLASMIQGLLTPPIDSHTSQVRFDAPFEPSTPLADAKRDYREEQARLRAAGFDAYNCDMVDEFPRW